MLVVSKMGIKAQSSVLCFMVAGLLEVLPFTG
jgi:hypothetical protein